MDKIFVYKKSRTYKDYMFTYTDEYKDLIDTMSKLTDITDDFKEGRCLYFKKELIKHIEVIGYKIHRIPIKGNINDIVYAINMLKGKTNG